MRSKKDLNAMKLKKELGLLEVFCISSGAMISSGLFVLPAIAYSKAGPYVIFAYMLAGILVIPTILSKAELVTAMPKTGGVYYFTDRSMGPMMGTLGGLAAWFSLAFKSAFALLGIGIFALLFNPGLTILQIKIIAVICVLIFTVVNLLGVKLAGRIQTFIVITLLVLLTLYVITGVFFIDSSRFRPETSIGLGSVFATAGLVFVSYAGTTKIAAVAGEVKDPGRNLPLGMFFSWGVVTMLYIMVIFVTVGTVAPGELRDTLTPITLGGEVSMGLFGIIIMSFAAILAYISTGNAGILAASRDPMAMGKDDLLPRTFGNVSKRGTPWVAILFTSAFMIVVVLFLDLEDFVKTASTLKLILFILANLALIFMRESNIRHYRPKYKAPFYPYVQIFGIIGYGFLIFQMGSVPLMITGIFLACGLGWYFIYAHGKIKREYALLHVVERVIGIKSTDHLLDEELREVLIERDNILESRFEQNIKKCTVLDLKYFVPPEEFAEKVAEPLAKHLNMSEDELYFRLINREKKSNIMVRPGFAVISFHIKGRNKFEIELVRTKRGARFSDEFPAVRAAFIVVSSSDEQNFYLHSLMWMVQIAETVDFEKEWINAKDSNELREIILKSWRKRGIESLDIKEIEKGSQEIIKIEEKKESKEIKGDIDEEDR
ncbi:MAG: amino acid permease [Thermoplasmata archaeon]|nr:MAG: amino acid permease [Thermoplasmata archaeon]